MNIQEWIEFFVRMSVNSGRTQTEAWESALSLLGVRS